jgi:hypothetical protein
LAHHAHQVKASAKRGMPIRVELEGRGQTTVVRLSLVDSDDEAEDLVKPATRFFEALGKRLE